jgi:hypothetical protein
MARSTPDVTLAAIVLGYLQDAASITAGVPSQSTLPKFTMDTGKTAVVPCFTVVASEGQSVGNKRILTVAGMLMAILRNADSNAPADSVSLAKSLTRDQAGQYLDAIESRLRDLSALNTYLASLSTDARDGWTILKIVCQGQPKIEREKDGAHFMTLACALEITVFWSRAV